MDNSHKVTAIIFDADNTLYATKAVAKPCDRRAIALIAKAAKVPTATALGKFSKIVLVVKKSRDAKKRTRAYSYSLLAKKIGAKQADARRAAALFEKEFLKKLRPRKGVAALLSRLSKTHKLAVATSENRPWAQKKLKAAKIYKFFSTIVTAKEVGRMKPDSRYFSIACKKLGATPSECLVIGDDLESDIRPARKLGMKACGPTAAEITRALKK